MSESVPMAKLEIRKGPDAEVSAGGLRFVACRREVGDIDGGITLYVWGREAEATEDVEVLRMDLFRERPHYHAPAERQEETRIEAGDVLGALDEFYCENVQMQEGVAAATQGRAVNRKRLEAFLGSLSKFNGATLHSSAVSGDVSLSEWTFDMVGGDGEPIVWNEVIRRRWKDGIVVHERYYNP